MANETDKMLDAEIERLQKRISRSAGEEATRQLGLTARAAGPAALGAAAGAAMGAPFAGIGAIPGALAGAAIGSVAMPLSDLAVTGYNYLTGGDRPTPSAALEQGMTQIGLPEPENATERVVQSASRGVLDGALGARAFRGLADATGPRGVPAAPPPGQPSRFAGMRDALPGAVEAMAEGPGLQTLSAGTGATVASTAHELGAGPATSMLLGMGAGMLPNIRPQHVLPSQASAERQRLNTLLKENGVPLSPAQDLSSAPASVMESVMRYLPTSAARVAAQDDAQGRGYTSAINRHAGIQADNALPETLQRAQSEFGQRYDALEAATMVQPDAQFGHDLGRLKQTYTRGLNEQQFELFNQTADKLDAFVQARAQGAVIPGANYHMIDGELRVNAAKFLKSDDPSVQQYGRALSDLRDSFQGLMERSAVRQQKTQVGNQVLSGTELSDAWREANKQYAIFSRIKDAMGNATGRDKLNTGFIPPSALAQEQRRAIGPQNYGMARDPFTDLVRAGQAVLPDPVPNSGTAQRSFMQNMLTGGQRGAPAAVGAAGAHAAGLSLIDPAMGLALPWAVANRWYAKPQSNTLAGLLSARAMQGAGKPFEGQ